MVLYGEPMEDYMAETDDPVIKAIWEGKDVVEFASIVEGAKIFNRLGCVNSPQVARQRESKEAGFTQPLHSVYLKSVNN